MKKLILVFAMILCLCGCSAGETAQINITQKQYETDFSAVDAQELSLSYMENTEFQAELNTQLSNDLASALVAFDSLAQENSGNVSMGNKSVFTNDWTVKYNCNGLLSLIDERYIYLGGAHGNTTRIPLNANAASGTVLELKDLFADENYKTTLNQMITALVEEHPDEYSDLWEKPEIKDSHQTDFYITDTDLVIFYQPYALSYYARGFVEFPISLEELSGYLTEEYRGLLLKNTTATETPTSSDSPSDPSSAPTAAPTPEQTILNAKQPL